MYRNIVSYSAVIEKKIYSLTHLPTYIYINCRYQVLFIIALGQYFVS
jgi:hypothetical protein